MRDRKLIIVIGVLLAGMLPGQAAADEVGEKAVALVRTHGPAIVSIRVVLDLEFQGQTREQRLETRGVAVSDSGLIMTTIEAIKPNVNVRDPRGRAISFKLTPADIKIIFENEEKEHDAFVAVKDTKRQLVFLQLKDFKPADRKIPWIDFSRSGTAKPGDQVVTVRRHTKGYDYANYFAVARVIGELKKPRKALLIDRFAIGGLPVFGLDGKLVGCQSRMKSGLEQGRARERPGGQAVILAAKEIHAVIKQALKKAAEGEDKAEEDEKKEEKVEKEEKEGG